MRLLLLLLLTCSACAARAPGMPGPLGVVGAAPRDLAHPIWDDADLDEEWDVDEGEPPEASLRVTRRGDPYGEALADAAEHYLKVRPRGFRDDCSGFVMACLDRAGTPISGNTRSLWDAAKAAGDTHHRKMPRVGDLAFFDNTYDRNGNGRWDDPLSHIAVVLSVEADGTIHMAHAGTSSGRTTLTMNLRRPGDRHDEDGKVLNDWLRRKKDRDPKHFRYLSGELWRGFATWGPDATAEAD